MSGKLTQEEFEERVRDQWENRITILGKYKNIRKKVLVRCNKCGNEYYQASENILRGYQGCENCFVKVDLHTHEHFLEFVPKQVLEDCEFLTKYIKNKAKILCKCKKCGHEHWKPAYSLKKRYSCPYCGDIKRARDNELFQKEFYEKNPHFILLDDYRDRKTSLSVMCVKCGLVRKRSIQTCLKGLTCLSCSRRLPYYKVVDKIKKVHGDEYEILSIFKQGEKSALVKHMKCGHEWTVRLNSLYSEKTGCPKCNESKGEKRITKFLIKNNISHKEQFKFNRLLGLNGGNLSFDFYLPDYNTLIEYDGEFHYLETSAGNDLKRQQEHDRRKDEYAMKQNIKLIRIPYWDFDRIEEILVDNLLREDV